MRSKVWVKDRNFVFVPGDIVKLVRKKENGHPRALELGGSYQVVKIENDDLYLKNQRSPEGSDFSIIKVNRNYFVPIERMRDELISEIFS
jgi:hypothetical protein